METYKFPLDSLGGLALNRTIVGWKPVPSFFVLCVLSALNRTIVGWKQESPRSLIGTGAPLNRTIVGWKPEVATLKVVPDVRL